MNDSDDLRIVLDAINEMPREEWHSMDSAPKDGTAVLLWWPHWWHDPHPGYYLNNQWHSDKALSGGDDEDPNGPISWRYLPKSPPHFKEPD